MDEEYKLWEEFQEIIEECSKTKDTDKMKRRMNLLKIRFNSLKKDRNKVRDESLFNQLEGFL